MPWLIPVLQFLKEVGTPTCIVSGIIIFCAGIYSYERVYADSKYFTVEDGKAAIQNSASNYQLLVTIREDQLAEKITNSFSEWCHAKKVNNSDSAEFHWRLLQEKQRAYRELTKNGPYDPGSCRT